MIKAEFAIKLENEKVKCELCPHNCVITNQDIGFCRARKNINGELYSLSYNKTVSICIDPIEKKPLYHFYPGSDILSVGPNYCNLSCNFCQNYHISQQESHQNEVSKEKLLEIMLDKKIKLLAYTYSEPSIWFEYIMDSAEEFKRNGIKTVLVTNGYINEKPLLMMLPYIDAMNIDLKAMDNNFYENVCSGSLDPVLQTIKTAYQFCHIEITNLLIPNYNDSKQNIEDLINFINSVDRNIPLHFSRYFPQYRMMEPPTPYSTLTHAYETARKILNYVYLGNVVSDNESNTYCPNCKTTLIARVLGNTMNRNIKKNEVESKYSILCKKCNHEIYGKC